MAGFRLIETMRVSEGGEVYLLDRHLARLSRSASHFSFNCDVAAIRNAVSESLTVAKSVCLRLVLDESGSFELQVMPLPAGYFKFLKLATVRVDSSDLFLSHKTTTRGIYEQARNECDAKADALLSNERGEITETPIMNVAVLRDGRWITPRESCGLLPGVMREELLSRGEIEEGVVRAEELQPGERIRCFNALRGICEAQFDRLLHA